MAAIEESQDSPLADDSEVFAQITWNLSQTHLLKCHYVTGSSSCINIINIIISFLFWSHSKWAPLWWTSCCFPQCKSMKNSGRCLWLAKRLILLHENVVQPCTQRDITSLQSFVPATSHDMSRGQSCTRFMLHGNNLKVSTQMRGLVTVTCPRNMSQQHFLVCKLVIILPQLINMSLLHVPAWYPLSVYITRFLLLLHVAATCPLVLATLI